MLPQAKHWEVRVGEYHQKMIDGYEQTYQVSDVFHYPLYKGYDNDIALMKLIEPVKDSEFVKPICLPPSILTEFYDKECIASGWGKLDHSKWFGNNKIQFKLNLYCQFSQTKKDLMYFKRFESKYLTIPFVKKRITPNSKLESKVGICALALMMKKVWCCFWLTQIKFHFLCSRWKGNLSCKC